MKDLINKQHQFFRQRHTFPLAYRMKQLNLLYRAVLKHQSALEHALKTDLGKSEFESYTTEIGFILSSITHTKKHLKNWMQPRKVKTPVSLFPSSCHIEWIPYGSVLIIGPYNYPFQLVVEPLIGAIAAGNCAVISPSELTPHVSSAIKTLIEDTFPPEYITCVDSSVEMNTRLLHNRFDYIFFTGSTRVGKVVMKAAAENLIPVTLELGGKSPVIVDKTTRLTTACERIVWGKFMNAGQTCVAPDYVFVDVEIKEDFIQELKKTIRRFYGEQIHDNPDFGRIVNQTHMERIQNILMKDQSFIRFGGHANQSECYVEPTILCPDGWDAACMQEELFAPLLPVLEYKNLNDALAQISAHETPLALYVFSENKAFIRKVLFNTESGGVSINDTVSHLINPNLPFGGKGHSGMGAYHGKQSFLTFSHKRSVLKKSTKISLPLIFPPFHHKKLNLIKKVLR